MSMDWREALVGGGHRRRALARCSQLCGASPPPPPRRWADDRRLLHAQRNRRPHTSRRHAVERGAPFAGRPQRSVRAILCATSAVLGLPPSCGVWAAMRAGVETRARPHPPRCPPPPSLVLFLILRALIDLVLVLFSSRLPRPKHPPACPPRPSRTTRHPRPTQSHSPSSPPGPLVMFVLFILGLRPTEPPLRPACFHGDLAAALAYPPTTASPPPLSAHRPLLANPPPEPQPRCQVQEPVSSLDPPHRNANSSRARMEERRIAMHALTEWSCEGPLIATRERAEASSSTASCVNMHEAMLSGPTLIGSSQSLRSHHGSYVAETINDLASTPWM